MAPKTEHPPRKAISFAEDYAILPPTTVKDEGKPSESPLKDTRRILALIQDERHLTAFELYQSVLQRLDDFRPRRGSKNGTSPLRWRQKATDATAEEHEYHAARDLIASEGEGLDKLDKKVQVLRKAQTKLNVDEDWTLSQTLFGVTTYYRREQDNSLSIKMEGDLDGVPLFEQVAVLREVDLHYKWAPFCSSSLTVKNLEKLDTVGWFLIGLRQFGLARDGVFRAFGCDSMMEDGTILLVGQGLEDRSQDEAYAYPYLAEVPEDLDIPVAPTRLGSGRMTIREFSAVVRVLSPTSVTTKMVANINPNLSFVPQSLLDFIMRKLCGVVFSKLQHAAKKAHGDPVKNAHAKRMRREEAFYKGWLMAKFQAYCERMSWIMPPVPAFQLRDEDLEREFVQLELNRSPGGSHSFYDNQKSDESLPESSHVLEPSPSAPILHRDTDDDVSAVTNASSVTSKSSMFSNNPMSQYLRDMEAKTRAIKAAKVAAARKRAEDRLMPKGLSEDRMTRLEQLKLAKARRRGIQSRESADLPEGDIFVKAESARVPSTIPRLEGGILYRLHGHGRTERFVVTAILVVALFLTLNADTLLGFDTVLTSRDSRLWMQLLFDLGTLVYISLCGAVHFIVCFVSLVYAFDALDLGMKSGREFKQFYSSTVGLGAAATSCMLTFVSIVRSVVYVWLRLALWYWSRLNSYSRTLISRSVESFDTLGDWRCPTPILDVVSCASDGAAWLFDIVYSLFVSLPLTIGRWIHDRLLPTYFVGRLIGTVLSFASDRVLSLVKAWDNVLVMYEGKLVDLSTWRGQAIETSKSLLSYSAVFLLSCLVLFNISAKQRKPRVKQDRTETAATAPAVSSATARRPSAPGRYERILSTRVSSLTTTPEEESGMDDDMSSSIAQLSTGESERNGRTTRTKKHRRLRFRRKKKPIPSATIHEHTPSRQNVTRSKTF